MSWPQLILALLLIGLCCILMLVILLQRGRGGGLAGAFGGGGGGAFGAKTGDVLTWATVVIASVFLLLAVVANFAFDQSPKAASATKPEATEVSIPISGATSPAGTVVPTSDIPLTVVPVDTLPGLPQPPVGAAKPATGGGAGGPTGEATDQPKKPDDAAAGTTGTPSGDKPVDPGTAPGGAKPEPKQPSDPGSG